MNKLMHAGYIAFYTTKLLPSVLTASFRFYTIFLHAILLKT